MTAFGGHARNAARALAWLLASLPGVALACPVCFASKDEANRIAFLITTALLTALPVIMIGGIIVWIARRSQQLDLEEREPQPQAAPVVTVEPSPQAEPAEAGALVPLRR